MQTHLHDPIHNTISVPYFSVPYTTVLPTQTLKPIHPRRQAHRKYTHVPNLLINAPYKTHTCLSIGAAKPSEHPRITYKHREHTIFHTRTPHTHTHTAQDLD